MPVHPSITANLHVAYQHEDVSTLWQDTAGTTASTTGDPVGRWDDQQNSHNLIQGTTSEKPTHTADGINFSSDHLEVAGIGAAISGKSDYTLYIVADVTWEASGDKRMLYLTNTGDSNPLFIFGQLDTEYRMLIRDDNGSFSSTTNGTVTDGLAIYTIVFDSTDMTAYRDGVEIITIPYTANTITFNFSEFFARGSGSNPVSADVLAMYGYSDAHGSGDRGTIESDLDAAYINPPSETPPITTTILVNKPEYIQTVWAGGAISKFNAVYLDTTDNYKAKAAVNTAEATAHVSGIALADATDGELVLIAISGAVLTCDASTFTADTRYVLSDTAGEMGTDAILSGGDYISEIGFANSETEFVVDILNTGVTA